MNNHKIKSFLIEHLLKYVSIDGNTNHEKVILDEIEKDIKSHKLQYTRSGKFGIGVIKGELKEAEHIVLIDSHVDKVQKGHINPTFEEKSGMFTATGLDNRVGCCVNLLLALNLNPRKGVVFMFIFSVREELDGTGILKFIQSRTRKERKKWCRFYELEVAHSKNLDGSFEGKKNLWNDEGELKEYDLSKTYNLEKLPELGCGICPIDQCWGNKSKVKNNTNTRQVRQQVPQLQKDNYIRYRSVPVIDMHYMNSKCVISDVVRLFRYVLGDVSEFCISNKK